MELINNYINEYICSNNSMDKLFEKLCEKFAESNPNDIFAIKFIMADRFEYYSSERNDSIKKICEEREGQATFRNNLILEYDSCIITGDNSIICEAAHIIPYSISKNFDVANGLLLNKCFHKMFDDYLFSIDSDNRLEFSNRIFNMRGFGKYLIYNGKKLIISPKSKTFLNIHYKKFIEKNI